MGRIRAAKKYGQQTKKGSEKMKECNICNGWNDGENDYCSNCGELPEEVVQ